MINIITSIENYILFENISYYKNGDKMINKPTLFVSSVFYGNDISKNQILYDSRKNAKNKVFHRLDDIKSFILFGKKVYINARCNVVNYEGYVVYFDNKCIQIKYNEITRCIFMKDIDEIKIINVT